MAQDVVSDMVGRLAFQVDPTGLTQFNKGMDQAKASSDAAGVKAVAFGNILSDLASKAANTAISLVKLAVSTGVDLVEGFAESSHELDQWSKRLNIGTKELQELGGVASGVPKVIEKLREGLGEMALRGSGPAFESLGALGIQLEDIDGLSASDQLRLVAEGLRDLPSDAERTKIALELLGEEGAAMLPKLAQGEAGIDAMIARSHELGLVLDDSAIAKGKEAKQAMRELDAEWQQAANTAATALAPVFTDLTRGTAEWLDQNQHILAQDLPAFIERVVDVGGDAITWVMEFADDVNYLVTEVDHLTTAIGDGLVGAYEAAEPVINVVGDAISYTVDVASEAAAEIEEIVMKMAEAVGLADEIRGKAGERGTVAKVLDPLGVAEGFLLESETTNVRGSSHLVGQEAKMAAEHRTPEGLGSQEIQQALGRDDINSTTRRRLEESLPRARKREAEAAARANAKAFHEAGSAYQDRVDAVNREAETSERRKRAEKFRRDKLDKGGSGGKEKVDTTEAEALFGPEIASLAKAANVGEKAIKAALEAAAKSLQGGDSQGVARKAAIGVIEQKSGVDYDGATGPDAALFGLLTKIGGVEAARSATDGARFVRIDQSVNTTYHIDLQVPESYAGALTQEGWAEGVTAILERTLSERDRVIIEHHQRAAVSP